jgi:NodT family efflux transporter outer membrane factor (OMF) lipoprotein
MLNRDPFMRTVYSPKVSAIALLMMLAGCAPQNVVHQFDAKTVVSQETHANAEHSYAVLPKAQDSSHRDWWETLGDDQLTKLEQLALGGNFELKESLARLRQSQALAGMTASEKYPELSGTASYTRRALSEHNPYVQLGAPTKPTNTWAVMGALNWELDLWGHLDAQLASANAQVKVSEAELEGVKLSLSADVADAYFGWCALSAQKQIIDQLVTLSDQYTQMVKNRVAQGVSTQNAIYQAEAEHASRIAERIRIEKALNHAENRIALLIGKAPEELKLTYHKNTLQAFNVRVPDAVLSTLVQQRPDVMAAQAKLESALAEVDVAKTDFYPRVSLNGEAGLTNGLLSTLDNSASREYHFGPSVYLPIFNAGKLKQALTLASVKHEEVGQNYLSTVFSAWIDVNQRLADLHHDGAFEDAIAKANHHAEQDLILTGNSLKEGTASQLDWVGAKMRQLPYESALINARLQKASALVGLYRSIGGGWPSSQGDTEGNAVSESSYE